MKYNDISNDIDKVLGDIGHSGTSEWYCLNTQLNFSKITNEIYNNVNANICDEISDLRDCYVCDIKDMILNYERL